MTVRAYSMDYDDECSFTLSEPIARDDAHPWSNYVRGVFAVLLAEGHSVGGLDIAVTGDVPVGAGLSSSAALEVATAGAVRAAWGLESTSLPACSAA
jgi:galactokinase